MKYIKSLEYISPLNILLNDIESLKAIDGFSLLEKHVESLISLDYEKFIHPFILKSLENNKITEDTKIKESSDIFSIMEKQKDKLKNLIILTNSTKRDIKKSFPDLWHLYLDIKSKYGEKRYLEHDNITGTLKGLTDPLLNFVSLFTNNNSFEVNNFIKMQNKKDETSEAFKLFTNYKKSQFGNKILLSREELKLIPVQDLVNFVELIALDLEHITDNDIYHSINDNNIRSDKKSLKKLIKNRKNIDFIKEWWSEIEKNDKNKKLITIS